MIPLRHKNTVAGRVVAAILRAEIDPGYWVAESVAYKCAFHDQGSHVKNHLLAADRDALLMRVSVRDGQRWPFHGITERPC